MQQTGRVTIKRDGSAFRSKPGAKIDPGGVKRTPEKTDQGVTMYKEENVPPMVECTIMHTSDLDILDLSNAKDWTLTFQTDTGVTYTIANAFTVEPVSMQNGECPVKFSGDNAK